jgi:hypothetical protein
MDAMPMPSQWRHRRRRNVVERVEKLHVLFPALDRATMYDLAMSFWTPWEISSLLGGDVAKRECVAGTVLRRPDGALRPALLPAGRHPHQGRPHHHGRRPREGASRSSTIAWRSSRCACRPRCAAARSAPSTCCARSSTATCRARSIDRPKQGFAIPLASWMRGELAPLLDNYLDPQRIREAGIFDPAMVSEGGRQLPRRAARPHDRLDVQKVWLLVAFEMWRERWATGSADLNLGVEHARAVHY